ncbi:Farnesyl diphosphate synthase [Rubripirellula lacrimiformis]|uniref:Farnesyl diphosphate synthase n=1 Tax=Rubripirellula lacrimiformis TaxID=1930273 RepID=A0A517N8H5_9BACT|nr:farnesyl diphosphate synthase [Rubripirellula lacrimiformis]QDT03436.1 Farnesyl diphosphate synthase [Rubripirellula lacrimiformis]
MHAAATLLHLSPASRNIGRQILVNGKSASGIDDLKPWIESSLESACEFGAGCPETLAAAMRYALLAPGKRLRPALVLMAGEACHQNLDDELRSQLMPGAVAVEMIHAYSLIHDDLPAMDDDDLRRGRPTVHIQFDEATAILAGDALQAQAFRHLAESVADPARAVAAIRSLSQAASATGLVGGQADDLAAEKRDDLSDQDGGSIDWLEHLESIHRRKTGALFAASLDLGAILAGADQSARSTLAEYASDLGLAFQVVDDLLDHTADDADLGKRTGKDADRGKLTYPGLLGMDGARDKANELVESAKCRASVFGAAGWRLTWLADYVLERKH